MRGASLVIDGRLSDVMRLHPNGNMYVRDVITGECRWVDYYTNKIVDPSENPEALLEAMSHIRGKEDTDEEPGQIRAEGSTSPPRCDSRQVYRQSSDQEVELELGA